MRSGKEFRKWLLGVAKAVTGDGRVKIIVPPGQPTMFMICSNGTNIGIDRNEGNEERLAEIVKTRWEGMKIRNQRREEGKARWEEFKKNEHEIMKNIVRGLRDDAAKARRLSREKMQRKLLERSSLGGENASK